MLTTPDQPQRLRPALADRVAIPQLREPLGDRAHQLVEVDQVDRVTDGVEQGRAVPPLVATVIERDPPRILAAPVALGEELRRERGHRGHDSALDGHVARSGSERLDQLAIDPRGSLDGQRTRHPCHLARLVERNAQRLHPGANARQSVRQIEGISEPRLARHRGQPERHREGIGRARGHPWRALPRDVEVRQVEGAALHVGQPGVRLLGSGVEHAPLHREPELAPRRDAVLQLGVAQGLPHSEGPEVVDLVAPVQAVRLDHSSNIPSTTDSLQAPPSTLWKRVRLRRPS
jgi:hypothetical protein